MSDVYLAIPLRGGTLAPDTSALALGEYQDSGHETSAERPVAPLHVHHDEDEAWYVIDGRLRFTIGDSQVEVPAGGAVIGPRGIPHAFWNPGPEPARYLIVMMPKTARMLKDMHELTAPTRESREAVMRAHGIEPLA